MANDFENTNTGWESEFYYSSDGGSTWERFPNVESATPPALTWNFIDTTHLTTPNKIATYKRNKGEPGNATIEYQYESAFYSAIHTLHVLGDKLKWKYVISDDNDTSSFDGNVLLITFDGTIESLTPPVPNMDKVMSGVNIKVSGTPTVSVEDGMGW